MRVTDEQAKVFVSCFEVNNSCNPECPNYRKDECGIAEKLYTISDYERELAADLLEARAMIREFREFLANPTLSGIEHGLIWRNLLEKSKEYAE